jgi:hypothetical protein
MIEYAPKISSRLFTPTTPIVEPVTLAEAKEWLQVDYSDKDDMISAMITAARRLVEIKLGGISLIPGTAWFVVDIAREGDTIGALPFALSNNNIASLVVNELVDGEDDELMVIEDDYYHENGELRMINYGTYRVNYSVAYTTFPQDLKEAIMMIVAYRFNNRGDQERQLGLPADAREIINGYKLTWL